MREAPAQVNYEQDVELLLASANAIERLITERRALRHRVSALESELKSLRQQANLVHDSYRTLTDEFVMQFKLIDNAVGNIFREPEEASSSSPEQPAAEKSTDYDRSSAAA